MTYDLDPPPPTPSLRGHVTVRPTPEDLLDSLGADFLIHALNCVRQFGSFHIALSGGSTPMPFYKALMVDPNYRGMPWDRTHLWIVDERRVPEDDERSNFGHIRDILVDHSDIPRANVHPVRAQDDDADVRYERELVAALAARGSGLDRLDFVLLGMGNDGHTASLFPRSPAVSERRRLVRINSGPAVTPPERVTMTFPVINAARFIAVLVTGEGKRGTIEKVARAADPVEDLPILGIAPLGGTAPGAGVLRWYLDRAACPPGEA